MYAATTKDEGNAADGRFSTACLSLTLPKLHGYFIETPLRIAPAYTGRRNNFRALFSNIFFLSSSEIAICSTASIVRLVP